MGETMKKPNAVYCDGGLVRTNPSPWGGVYAWVQVDTRTNTMLDNGGGLILPVQWETGSITNNQAELVAMLSAIGSWPLGVEGVLYTDSALTIGRVFGNDPLTNLPGRMAAWVRSTKRGPKIGLLSPMLIAGHPTKVDLGRGANADGRPVSEWNVWVDDECNRLKYQFEAGLKEGGNTKWLH
jgi:hypothetical protein